MIPFLCHQKPNILDTVKAESKKAKCQMDFCAKLVHLLHEVLFVDSDVATKATLVYPAFHLLWTVFIYSKR